MIRILFMTIIMISVISFVGCTTNSTQSTPSDQVGDQTESPSNSVFEKITASTAKEMIEDTSDIVILDVRTEEEYAAGYIEGALLVPDYEIEEKIEEVIPDKSTTILVYCRSGNRSAKAAKKLKDLGYTALYDFGGIIDWPYEIVTNN